jgi:hypothetical protein
MARVPHNQPSFARGVVSRKLHSRNDLELFYSALADGLNYVVTGLGVLEKRPGTLFAAPTKNNGPATLIPFAYSPTQAYMLEFGQNYVRPFANYAQVFDGGVISETATPYSASEAEELSFVQSNDVMFLAHPNHKYRRLARTSLDAFTLADFDTFDGPYLDINGNLSQKLAVSTSGVVTATGFAPFTAAMVGRWIRIRSPNTDGDNGLGDSFLWDFMQITSVTSSTAVQTNHTGGSIAATPDWRLGAFYAGNWPSHVTMHNGRLVLASANRVYFSKPQDFSNFAPTYHSSQGGATDEVRDDNAITAVLDSGLLQSGAISAVLWMRSQQFQLVIGTPAGIVTIQASSFGESLTPGNVVARPQDARGVSPTPAIGSADSTIFVHSTGQRVQGTYYKDGSYDRIGSQDLSLSSDDLLTSKVRRMAWQDFPHGLVWICLEDGKLLTLTLQPEEKVQGWMPQQLGGYFVLGGQVEHAHVESLAVIPSPDGTRTDVWFIVKRTIEGETRRYVEVLRPFRRSGADVRNSWYLDSALRYDGNDDANKTLAFSGSGPNEDWDVIADFTSPAFQPQQKLSFYDGTRWHRGTIITVDAENNFTWRPAAPNAPPGPADGLRWFFVSDGDTGGEWVRPAPDGIYQRSKATYVAPLQVSGVWQWSLAVNSFSGLEHLEGQTVHGLLDGFPSLLEEVEDGGVQFGGDAAVVLIGLPYASKGKLLPIEAGSQTGSAVNRQRPVYAVEISVYETYGLEAGTGLPSDAKRVWEYYEPTVFPPAFAEGEPPELFTGTKAFSRDEQGSQDNPAVAWRHNLPLPSTVRAVLVRLSTSDGR